MVSGRRALGAAIALLVAAATFMAAPQEADAVNSVRDFKCMTRADRYAENEHPNVPAQELADRIAWLYSQCQENRDAEAVAEEQGSMAEPLFGNRSKDRHAHPLHCMSFTDSRFGMHTEHNSGNPPDDLYGPGGSAAINIPGEFMYLWIDNKARFMVRYVVWTVDDRDGTPLTPVRINQHPTYMGTPQTTVAVLDFAQAYKPVSVWVEMPATMLTANPESGILPGRRLTVRAWMESHCHDKRDPVTIPQVLIDRMVELGWQRDGSTPQEPRAVRFKVVGNPNQASNWSLVEVPIAIPNQINTKGAYRWFYDSEVSFNPDTQAPTKPEGLTAEAVNARRVRLDWTRSSDDTEVAGYLIYRDGVRVGFTRNAWYVDKGLWPETDYTYKVIAKDTSGNKSPRSRIVTAATLPDTSPPTKPRKVTASRTSTSITLSWKAAGDNVGVSHYVIRSGGETIGTTSGLSFTITGLTPDTRYHYGIRAVDVFGNPGKLVFKHPATKP